MSYRLSLNEWLDFFGFSASSPFSKWEAEEEARLYPERLSEQLVKPACFDRVLGQASEPRTVLTFAPRGSGKTACRILVDYYCREGMGRGDRAETGGRVLSILHTQLDEAVRQSQESEQPIDEYWHTREILKQSVQALIASLRIHPELVERIETLAHPHHLDLQWFFYAYPPPSIADLNFMRERLNFRFPATGDGGEIGFVPSSSPRELHPELLMLLESRRHISPIDQLQLLVNLICADPTRGLGFQAVYVLVDGLDEFFLSADLSTDYGARLIIPLLTNLRLMNGIPRLAFKFFLPAEMMSFIHQHPAVRHDRLGYETITWAEADMREILRRRLGAYGPVQEIDMLCAPELRGLEKTLIHAADGNPRRMLRLCALMLDAHLDTHLEHPPEEIGETAYLLTKADWEEAQARLSKRSSQAAFDGDGEETDHPVHVVIGEEESESQIHSQDLSEHLTDYPAPIALLYLDYQHRQEPFERLGRLLDLFEVTVAFVGIILIAQLAALAGKETIKKIRSTNLRLKRMSLGGWLTIWEKLPGVCNSLGATFYSRRLQSIYNKERDRLNKLRILRNQTLGHGATGSEQDLLAIIAHYTPEVERVIASLHFLTDAHLVQVKDMQKQDGLFNHRVRVYTGDNPNFPWRQIHFAEPLECGKMLLIRQTNALQLYPLIVTAPCPQCTQMEIFIYQKIQNSEVEYLSYDSGHRLLTTQYRQAIQDVIGV